MMINCVKVEEQAERPSIVNLVKLLTNNWANVLFLPPVILIGVMPAKQPSDLRGLTLKYGLNFSGLALFLCLSLCGSGEAHALAVDQTSKSDGFCETRQPTEIKSGKSAIPTPTVVSKPYYAQVCIYNSAGHGELLLSKSLSYASKFIQAVNESKPASRKLLNKTACSAAIGPTMFIYFTANKHEAVQMTRGGCPWLVSSTSSLKFSPSSTLSHWKNAYFELATNK